MAKTSLTLHSFEHKPRKHHVAGNWDEVGGQGVLSLFEHFCRTVHPDNLVDRRNAKYLKVKTDGNDARQVSRMGRMVMVHVDSGIWGNSGSTYNVETHEPTHDRTDKESATVTTRVGLVVPPGSSIGVVLVEREGRQGEGFEIINHFRRALSDSWSGSHYPTARVTYPGVWADKADLTRVEVRTTKWRPSFSGSAAPSEVPMMAEMRRELRPVKGETRFKRPFKRRLLNRELDMSAILGVPDEEDADVVVELTDSDGHKKSFLVGDDRTPSMRVPLTEDNEPRLADASIRAAMFREAREFFSQREESWDNSWERNNGEEGGDGFQWNHKLIESFSNASSATDDD